MSSFDSGWDALAARMDEAVDDKVGDRISYQRAGQASPKILPGFVIIETDGEGSLQSIDETTAVVKRIKIRQSLLPTIDVAYDRIEHPKLGAGRWRPLGALPTEQGRYWLIDVQKV